MSETTELHRRTIDFDVTRVSGGSSVRGELVDVRQIALGNHLGKTHPAGIVHHMGLVAEIDSESTVRTVDAWMKQAPFEPSAMTAGEACRHILPNYQRLVGLKIDEAYAARVLEEIGGPSGCFHILSLAQCLPFAYTAARGERSRREIDIHATSDGGPGFRLDARLVDWTEGESTESRLRLDLEFPSFRIAHAEAEGARAANAAGLEGLAITRGFTALALERLGEARDLFALVVAMTPITAQASGAFAALLGFDLRPRSRARKDNPQVGSCHRWRSDGPLVALAMAQAAKGDSA